MRRHFYDLLDKTATDLIAAKKVEMDYAVSQYGSDQIVEGITISKDAIKEVYQDLYDDYCDEVNKAVADQRTIWTESMLTAHPLSRILKTEALVQLKLKQFQWIMDKRIR